MTEDTLEVRKKDDLLEAIGRADHIIMKKYMTGVEQYPVKEISKELQSCDINSTVRLNRIEKIVYDAQEDNQDKLMNVYHSVALCGGSIINVIVSDGKNVEYYLGTKTKTVNEIATCHATLTGTFEGNFPGSTLTLQKKSSLEACIQNIFEDTASDKNRIVSVVSGIPGVREIKAENKKFIQGIEKVIDAMRGRAFTLLTISDPISMEQQNHLIDNYESIHTQLSPFASTTLTYSESDSNSVGKTVTDGITKTLGTSLSNTLTNSTSSMNGVNQSTNYNATISYAPMGVGGSTSKGITEGTSSSFTRQSGTSKAETVNESASNSKSVGNTDTYTNTYGRTLQISFDNQKVNDILHKIESLSERIEDSMDLGLWNTATYCIAEDAQTSKMLAGAMESLCRGEKSTVESFAVATWTDPYQLKRVEQYLKKMSHPVLELMVGNEATEINPTSLVNGRELVIEAGLPQSSISGVPISEMVSFARNVTAEEEQGEELSLGQIYHMGKEENTHVDLKLESMSAHTLITGSTGSGKSNTVYQILTQLQKKEIHFLVIEPAKGEYKHVFGNRPDVNVYGTNERFSQLLKINPFSFPASIHVLEHVDRLIEIFNVCWPMYAAMPAVLKDAVLGAYESCGWDLESSMNRYDMDLYPTFLDLQNELIRVIEHSAYSEEVKGNYIGSLATRIKSLTNGMNGMMFTGDEISEVKLFDENTIVDLSRVGSAETKSLIMGILVMKLNEYRMSEANGRMNQPLKHITVLEEAHNLLRNTTNSSSGEGGDIAGKSVEMITNSIAEVRTYGEGFIIVDQSPSAIDISAIRNTNTKIIMRLPEESDRQQAGKSAALTDQQIAQLAKLPKGVAVVYQNNWLDPVLCKINKANVTESVYQYEPSNDNKMSQIPVIRRQLLSMLMKNRMDEKIDHQFETQFNEIERGISQLRISSQCRLSLLGALKDIKQGKEPGICDNASFAKLSGIVVEVLGCNGRLEHLTQYADQMDVLQQELRQEITRSLDQVTKELELAVSQCMIRNIVEKDEKQIEMYARWREYAVEQRKLV